MVRRVKGQGGGLSKNERKGFLLKNIALNP